MNKILLVGNSGLKRGQADGQTIKVRLYLKKICDEGFEVCFVDLESFFLKPISTLRKIKRGVRECERIVLITAERGSKILIPYINKINKKYKKVFIFPLVGSSVLHYTIDCLSDQKKQDFLLKNDFSNLKPKKRFVTELRQIDYILPETDSLSNTFKEFYGLVNVFTLTNFRETMLNKLITQQSETLKVVFLSRVMEEKGIFDLLECVNTINKNNIQVTLDIYGKLDFDKDQKMKFSKLISFNGITYHGVVPYEKSIKVLSMYDLFVFPTRFYYEGTPGVIVESLIAGTPILTSGFPQVHHLLKNNFDSIFYEMFNTGELKEKLLYIIGNKDVLQRLKQGSIESGKRFTYDYNRKLFLKYICGVEEE